MDRILKHVVALAATLAVPAWAQQAPSPKAGSDVVVRGAKRTAMSGWREAETRHLVVLSDGGQAELIRVTRNLERLHFLLSGLLGRADTGDDPIRLCVTLIGDVPTFEALDLRNWRWQQGPYNSLFQLSRYYDPRQDGAVMATTRVDQRTVIEHTRANAVSVLSALSDPAIAGNLGANDPAARAELSSSLLGQFATGGMRSEHDLTPTFGERAIDVSADSLLYGGFAQHYLQTYFPAAYPRWYLDGFGQVFASLVVKGDTVLEYGRIPRGTSAVLNSFGSYPIADVLGDKYLTANPRKTRWTPIHAWMLTHFMLFSDTRRPQLRQYLAARARGDDAASAAQSFGDPKALTKELRAYFGARKPYEVVTYPADRIEEPVVRRLTQGQAAFVKGRLELGGRTTVPPGPGAATPPDQARRMTSERESALRQRARWLERLRDDAARWGGEADAQLLLAEAECRSDNADRCLAAADRAAALAPDEAPPLAWRATALVMQAGAAPAADRPARLAEARRAIAAANRADTEAVQPFFAYYDSFAAAGQPPSVTAIDGLQKAVGEVPDAPQSRLALATALASRGQIAPARQVIMPVAAGPYDSPERPAARALAGRTAPAPSDSPPPRP